MVRQAAVATHSRRPPLVLEGLREGGIEVAAIAASSRGRTQSGERSPRRDTSGRRRCASLPSGDPAVSPAVGSGETRISKASRDERLPKIAESALRTKPVVTAQASIDGAVPRSCVDFADIRALLEPSTSKRVTEQPTVCGVP